MALKPGDPELGPEDSRGGKKQKRSSGSRSSQEKHAPNLISSLPLQQGYLLPLVQRGSVSNPTVVRVYVHRPRRVLAEMNKWKEIKTVIRRTKATSLGYVGQGSTPGKTDWYALISKS